jgi:hypothetical protein
VGLDLDQMFCYYCCVATLNNRERTITMITKLFELVGEIYRNILLAREAAGLGRRGSVEEVRAFLQQATK